MSLYCWLLRRGLLLYKFLFRPQLERVRCIITKADKVLLVRHSGGGHEWSLPGGGAHADETHSEAIAREIKEELSLSLRNIEALGVVELQHEYAELIAHILRAEAETINFKPDKWEIYEAGWFELTQLPQPLSPVATEAFARFKK